MVLEFHGCSLFVCLFIYFCLSIFVFFLVIDVLPLASSFLLTLFLGIEVRSMEVKVLWRSKFIQITHSVYYKEVLTVSVILLCVVSECCGFRPTVCDQEIRERTLRHQL